MSVISGPARHGCHIVHLGSPTSSTLERRCHQDALTFSVSLVGDKLVAKATYK